MKERPILFSGEMVRAILDGRKTQTRRVVKYIPMLGGPLAWCAAAKAQEPGWVHIVGDYRRFCPYGEPGHRLWVRETHYFFDGPGSFAPFKTGRVWYRADGLKTFKWRPSIFMPRWASRIMLEIVSVRVERVQGITEEDAKAEGITGGDIPLWTPEEFYKTRPMAARFAGLWMMINNKRGFGWDTNPWVWVIEFRRVKV